jgi:uncharacterized protein
VSYLNSLYKAHAEKAGVVYVDVWDGFVDEGGHFALQGPDFEGQTRRLRAPDGVHFTKYGALKLAHYVEHELRRLMQSHLTPMAIPLPEDIPQTAPSAARPGEEPARPVAGPVVPLTTFSGGSEELIGGRGSAAAVNTDATATRVLVKGETAAAPQGRADDFTWPRPTASADEIVEIPATPVAQRPIPKRAAQARHTGRAAPSGQMAQTNAKGQEPGPRQQAATERERRATRRYAR